MVLAINNLTGFGGGFGTFTYSFVGSVTPGTISSPVATASSASIGAEGGVRSILVGYTFDYASAGGNTFTCTIGGQAMTQVTAFEDDNAVYCGFFILDYPSGTTADIAMTASLTMNGQIRFHIWSVYNLANKTPTNIQNFDINGGVTPDFNVPITSGNNATFSVRANNVNATHTWTGLTERSDATIGLSGHSAADAYNSAGSSLNVTNPMSGGNGCLSCIHFSQ